MNFHTSAPPSSPLLYVVHSLGTGGIERILFNLCSSLVSAGVEVHVCCLCHAGTGAERFARLGVRLHVLGGVSSASPAAWPRNILVFARLVKLVAEIRPAILQAEMFYGGSLGRTAGILCGVPVIVHGYHGIYTWKGPLARLIDRILCRYTESLVCPSEYVAAFTADQLGISPGRFTTIPNGLGPPPGDCRSGTSPGGTAPAVEQIRPMESIVYCGRLVEEKRPDLALDIFLELAGSRPELHMRIVGEGPLRSRLETRIAESGVAGDRVEMAGFVEDPSSFLGAADLVLLPSRSEGFGMVAGEALLNGTAVLMSDLPALRETYGFLDDRFFVRSCADIGEWSARAVSLLDDGPARQEAVATAGPILSSKFSVDDMVRKYFTIYGLPLDRIGQHPEACRDH